MVYLMKWFFKRVFGEEEKKYKTKNRKKSHNHLFRIVINLRKNFTENVLIFTTLQREKELSRGTILIEFAVCMPILIVLLFYISDLVKIKRTYSQMKFIGQQMANILQNIARNKTLKYSDLCYAASLAYLTTYPGKTMYSTTNGQVKHELVHCPFFMIYYVKGTTGGNAKCLWSKHITTNKNTNPNWTLYGNYTAAAGHSTVKYSSGEVAASSIYPTLKIEDGKPKIILETTIFWSTGFMDKNGKKLSNSRQAFGLRFADPKHYNSLYFNTAIIFSPSKGFPEIRPDS